MKRGRMIDAATYNILSAKTGPPTLTDGQIKAELILYEMEEDRFYLEYPDVAIAHRRMLLDIAARAIEAINVDLTEDEEEILQAA
jgi:hypothetical protein